MTPFPRIMTVLLLLTVSILGPVTVPSPVTAQNPNLTFSIAALNPQSIDVPMTATEGGTATFKARATVNDPNGEPVSISLSALTSTGWPTTIDPDSFSVTASKTENLTIVVTVPKGTPSSNIAKLTVSGKATYSGGTLSATSSATVTVQQYPGLDMAIMPTQRELGRNSFEFRLNNTGNGLDSYRILILNETVLHSKHITVSISAREVDNIAHGKYTTVKMNVDYSGDQNPMSYSIELRIESLQTANHGKPTYWNYTVQVFFKGPETGVPNWAFAGGIAAFSITMIIVLVAIMRWPKKNPPAV